jgi:hypothetical protein
MPPAADRLYLGWQYATPHPDPGPPPRRPSPPEHERLSPAWAAAQRREENLLNQPLKAALAAVTLLGALAVAAAAAGWLPALAAGLAVVVCVLVAAVCGYGLWQGERALRSRMAEERSRVGKIRAAQESELFSWQAGHASRVREWQALRIAHEHQKRWYGVSVPSGITRVDLAGGTLSGWSAMLSTAAGHRLAAGAEVTVLDLTEGSVALDLITTARATGLDPLVWVLPDDLPRLGLGTGLDGRELADVLALVAGSTSEQASARDLAFDHAILERVIATLGGAATVGSVAAGLRALAQAGDPRADVAAGLLTSEQVDQLTAMFGRAAADRVVIERAWVLESQLRTLAAAGTAVVPLPRSPLRVLAVSHRAGAVEGTVLSAYLAVTATHALRGTRAGRPWQHTLFVLGADRLRGDTLDRFTAACEKGGTGLVLAYRSIPPHVRSRLGRGNAAVAYMRLGSAEDAKAASEQLGTEHRFVLSQLTETIGLSVTDTTAGSYTSTTGSVSSLAGSWSVSEGSTRGTGHGRTGSGVMPWPTSSSHSAQASDSHSTTASESVSTGINTSTAWGQTTSRATGDSASLAAALQRSREFLVEQHELQQLPPSAMIISYAGPGGTQVALADANPGIGGLRAATWLTLEEFSSRPAAPRARAAPESEGPPPAAAPPPGWRAGGERPAPNLGPPPRRLDWRRGRS